jgi:hypothetical protein
MSQKNVSVPKHLGVGMRKEVRILKRCEGRERGGLPNAKMLLSELELQHLHQEFNIHEPTRATLDIAAGVPCFLNASPHLSNLIGE